jgi:hypothetical protein
VGKAKRAHHAPQRVGTAQERLCPPYDSFSPPHCERSEAIQASWIASSLRSSQ